MSGGVSDVDHVMMQGALEDPEIRRFLCKHPLNKWSELITRGLKQVIKCVIM
jgi:hypothetical protein